ncbi:MAG: carboxynorspermidine decarboxylase [Bacteroidota bacterium]
MTIDYSVLPSPCFVLEEKRLRQNLAQLARVEQQAGVSIILAFKAFAMWSVFPIIREYLSGATASSLFEAQLCFEEMGVKAHTYAPAYLSEDMDQVLQYSSHITFNSLSQFDLYREKAKQAGISCGLRINPEYSEVETALYDPCAPGSRLGVAAKSLAQGLPDGIEGLHFHNLFEANPSALEATLKSVEEKFAPHLEKVKWVNMGGGHLITGKTYDSAYLIDLLIRFRQKYGVQVILEPGSAIAWQTGFLQTTILDLVEHEGIKTAMIDASFTAHMPDTLEMPYRPIIREALPSGTSSYGYRIGGMTCLAGDFLDTYYFEKPLAVGDVLIFEDMMHYTMVKTNMFNGVKHPSIAIWTCDDQVKILRQFDYTDFKARLS